MTANPVSVQTIDPDHSAFPPDAIFVRDRDLVLRRITSGDGKKVLWPTVVPGGIVTPQVAEQLAEVRHEGVTVAEIAAQFGLAKSTVKRHLRQHSGNSTKGLVRATDINIDFSAMKNTPMPYSVSNAIKLAIGTANTMAILSDQPIIQAHYQGYSVGFHAALAIICGAAGIDLSFLEEDHDDKSTSAKPAT